MKKIILSGLITILFISCQQQPQRFFTRSPEIDVTKALISDYQAGNWDAWARHFADTAKIYSNTIEPVSVKENKENLINVLSNVSSYKFDDGDDMFYEMIITEDDTKWVYFWGNWRGKLAANNQELVIPVHLALRFADGKIVREFAYFDISKFQTALQAIDAAKSIEVETNE